MTSTATRITMKTRVSLETNLTEDCTVLLQMSIQGLSLHAVHSGFYESLHCDHWEEIGCGKGDHTPAAEAEGAASEAEDATDQNDPNVDEDDPLSNSCVIDKFFKVVSLKPAIA